MTKKLIAVEEEFLPAIRAITKGDSLEPTTHIVSKETVVAFDVRKLVKAVGPARAPMMIRQFATQMRASLKNDIGADVPVVCITEDDEFRTLPPDFMAKFGWFREGKLKEGGWLKLDDR